MRPHKQAARASSTMLKDIVIDTNVLMHATNPKSGRQQQSVGLLRAMLDSDTALCLDTVFSGQLAQPESSLIWQEYSDNLGAPGFSSEFLTKMATGRRIVHVSRTVERSAQKWISRQIVNSRDRTFVRVALNSIERVLVSHDYQDFPTKVRSACLLRLGVEVLEAEGATVRVDSDGP